MNDFEYLYSILDTENEDERLRKVNSSDGVAWASDGATIHAVDGMSTDEELPISDAYHTAVNAHEQNDVIRVVISSEYLRKAIAGGDVVELSIPVNVEESPAPIKVECLYSTSYRIYRTIGRWAFIMPMTARPLGE